MPMKFSIYRFDPDADARPRMQDYTFTPAHDQRMLLDALM
jgi:succinate dehydrogenase / fumarate reductase iron-sulfur subunit